MPDRDELIDRTIVELHDIGDSAHAIELHCSDGSVFEVVPTNDETVAVYQNVPASARKPEGLGDSRWQTDRYGRHWPYTWDEAKIELCGECGQPDNCGDCNHGRLSDNEAIHLGASLPC